MLRSTSHREAEERERLRLRRLRQEQDTPPTNPTFRGAINQLRQSRAHEVIVSGPAETGKTFGALWLLHERMLAYPGATGAIIRKVRADMDASVLNTWRRVLTAYPAGVEVYGGSKPEWYRYPNGSIIYVGGMDRPGKVLSGERDFVFVNQAEELEREDWQTLTTRATGRGAVSPFTQVFGDCNPGPPHHWITQRPSLLILESRHEDNPSLYDDAGTQTEQGRRTMAVLDALEGVLKERLRYGRWVSAEGAVYAFDARRHLVDPFPIPFSWPRYRTIDFGFTNPFVCLWAALDPDGRIYIYRQWYRTQMIVEDHANAITAHSAGERYVATLADHDAEDRATLERHGVRTTAADKRLSVGIQAVQARLRTAGDGRPRLFIVRGSLIAADPELLAKRLPVNAEQEFDAYVWPKGADGKPQKEAPVDMHNHAMDPIRYLVVHLDTPGHGVPATSPPRPAVQMPRPAARGGIR